MASALQIRPFVATIKRSEPSQPSSHIYTAYASKCHVPTPSTKEVRCSYNFRARSVTTNAFKPKYARYSAHLTLRRERPRIACDVLNSECGSQNTDEVVNPPTRIELTLSVDPLDSTESLIIGTRTLIDAVDSANFDCGDNGSGGYGGGGHPGEGGDQDGDDYGARTLGLDAALLSAGKSLEKLPYALAHALRMGWVPISTINIFVALEGNIFARLAFPLTGMLERLLADPLFLTKVAIECGIGVVTKTAAEWEKRKSNFFQEIDFVFADLMMAIVADFCLVWLPAPTLPLRAVDGTKRAGRLHRFLEACPKNAFQVAGSRRKFTVAQRGAVVLVNGSKLLVVGCGASLLGIGMTKSLLMVRRKLQPTVVADSIVAPPEEDGTKLPLVRSSLTYGAYMATSSNLRYQIIAGVLEQRMLEPLLASKPGLLSVACLMARTANTFLGSLLWVDFARLTGLQPKQTADPSNLSDQAKVAAA